MIKLLLTSTALFTACIYSQANAQIQNMNPVPGDIFNYEYFNLTVADSGSVGANQVWDFSNAVSDGDVLTKTFRALTTQEQSNYPFANIAYTEDTDPTVYLMHAGADSLTEFGDESFMFNNPMVLFTYPISSTYNFTDNFGISGVAGASFDGTIRTFFQGSGTLITPFGTYHNVIKIRRKGTVEMDFFGTEEQIKADQYTWINAENKSVLLTIEKSDYVNDTEEDEEYGFFLKNGLVAGVDKISMNGFSLFPNPAADFVQVKSVSGELPVAYKIYSVAGSLILSGKYSEGGIAVNTLQSGEYIFEIELTNGSSGHVKFSKF